MGTAFALIRGMRTFMSVCALLLLVSACAAEEEGGVRGFEDFRPLTAEDLVHKSFPFGPDAGIFEADDPRFGQASTLIVGEVNVAVAGFALTTDDGSIQGGTLSLGSCLFQSTYLGLAGEEPEIGLLSGDFFYCGVDDEGRLGLLDEDEELVIISGVPSEANPDFDVSVSLSTEALVDPRFDPETRPETGSANLKLFGNVLSFALSVEQLTAGDELRDGRIHQGSAAENGEIILTLFGSPIQPVRQVSPPFIEGTSITASIFVTPDEVRTLVDPSLPRYVEVTSSQMMAGLLRGALPSTSMSVGPDGGTLRFPNHVVLDFPPGAVTEETSIAVDYLPMGRADAILLGRGDGFLDKRCLGGFLIEPHLEFAVPVKATVPVLPPRSFEVMWQGYIDYEKGEWWPEETDIEYFADRGVVEFDITHTSDWATMAASGSSTAPDWFRQSVLELGCQFSTANPACALLDEAQPPCCHLITRPETCVCCREKSQRQQSNATEYSRSRGSTICELLSDRVISTYYECTGSGGDPLVESHVTGELSPSCPPDTKVEVEIQPKPVSMLVCDTQVMSATARAVSETEGVVIPKIEFDPLWRTARSDIVYFPEDGVLEAVGPGSTKIFADTGLPSLPLGLPVSVEVRSNVSFFGIDGPTHSLELDEQATLTATLIHDDGGLLDPSTVSWSGGDPEILTLDTVVGSSTTVTAMGRGCVDIVASYQYDCESVEATIPVCVECEILTMALTPESATLVRGETLHMDVDVLDENGDPLDTSGVLWGSEDGSVARPSTAPGPTTLVEAVGKGRTEITATYDDLCQLKEARAEIEVSCVELELSERVVFLEEDETRTLSVRALGPDGQAVLIPEAEVMWGSDDPAVSVSPTSGSFSTEVRGEHPGHAVVTASYEDGACGTISAYASVDVTEDDGIGGTWELSSPSVTERCRYTGGDWWSDRYAMSFFTRVRELSMSDRIVASYIPPQGPALRGYWDEVYGDFELSVVSSNTDECGYLLTAEDDLCAGAIDCRLESCKLVTIVEGRTNVDVDEIDAHSEWYYSVTFSFGEPGLRGETTWECEGSANLSGERP